VTDPAAQGHHAMTDTVAFAAEAGAAIDRTFRAAMRYAGRRGGPGLRDRHGPRMGEVLIDFRTTLARPGGAVTATQFAAVTRYLDAAEVEASLARAVERGALTRDADGTITAADAGRAFLTDLYEAQAAALDAAWAAHGPAVDAAAHWAGSLVAAATAAPVQAAGALAAMTPNHEPAGTPTSVLLLNRLSALRYHRSDTHAAAWRAAGLTAAEMVRWQEGGGPERDAIEARTNEVAAPIFAVLRPGDRGPFLAALAELDTALSTAETGLDLRG
jgi:hypothetical protein